MATALRRPESRRRAAATIAARLTLEKISRRFGKTLALDAIDLDVRPGRDRGAARAFRLRQDNAAQDRRWRRCAHVRAACSSIAARWRPRRVFVPPEKRSIGLMFQDYALFPHLTVLAECHVRSDCARPQGARGGGACSSRPRRACASRPVLSARDLGRRAAARGARAGDRAPARRAPHGRAVLRPRQPAKGERPRRYACQCFAKRARRRSSLPTIRRRRCAWPTASCSCAAGGLCSRAGQRSSTIARRACLLRASSAH